MRFLFTVKYLFQSNFSPLNVLYYLKDLKDRARATHVAINILPPLFPTRSRDLLTYCGAFTAGGRGSCQAIVRPLKRNDSWKKAEIPRSNSPRVESRILYFFFFHRWRESMKFERGLSLLPSPLPLEERGCLREETNHWATSRANRIHTFLNAFTFYRETGFSRWKRRA